MFKSLVQTGANERKSTFLEITKTQRVTKYLQTKVLLKKLGKFQKFSGKILHFLICWIKEFQVNLITVEYQKS